MADEKAGIAQRLNSWFLGGGVSLKQIERSYRYDADGPALQEWIESLLTGEWAEDDADVDDYLRGSGRVMGARTVSVEFTTQPP